MGGRGMGGYGQQPGIILLREGTDSSQGKPQLISNINACGAVVDSVKSTLGPRGMDKLMYDGNKVTISNDGATIMKLLDIVHPAARVLAESWCHAAFVRGEWNAEMGGLRPCRMLVG